MARTAFPPAKFQSDGKLYAEPTNLLTAQLNGMLAISIIFLALSWICVALRVYVRAGLIHAFGIDDWCMVATLILFSIFAGILCAMSEWLLDDVAAYAEGQNPVGDMIPQLVTATYCVYSACMIIFKYALAFFFLKIFMHQKLYQYLIYGSIVLSTILGIMNIAWTAAFPCQVQSLFWTGLPSCQEEEFRIGWLVVTALWSFTTTITDIMYGVLSFLAMRNLQMARGTKITTIILCTLGSLGGLAAAVRLGLLFPALPGISLLGGSIHTTIWFIIEPGLGITAAAIATLRPLVQEVQARTGYSNGTHSSRHGTHANDTHLAEITHRPIITQMDGSGKILMEVEIRQTNSRREEDDIGLLAD